MELSHFSRSPVASDGNETPVDSRSWGISVKFSARLKQGQVISFRLDLSSDFQPSASDMGVK